MRIIKETSNIGIQNKVNPMNGPVLDLSKFVSNTVDGLIKGRNNNNSAETESRVIFIRHGITTEDEQNKEKKSTPDSSPQSSDAKLSEQGREQMRNAGRKLKEYGINQNNTLFIYSHDTERAGESLDELLYGLGFNRENVNIIEDIRLSTSPKKFVNGKSIYYENEDRLLKDLKTFEKSIQLMRDIRTNEEFKKYKHIILIGHKSNKGGIKNAVLNKDKPIEGDFDIKNGEQLEFNISKEGNWIKNEEKTILQINSEIHEILMSYGLGIRDNESIVDYQNRINHIFKINSLYDKVLLEGNHNNQDIDIFCIANLLKIGESKKVENFIQRNPLKEINEWGEIDKVCKKFNFLNLSKLISINITKIQIKDNELAHKIISLIQASDNIAEHIYKYSIDNLISANNRVIDRRLFTFKKKNDNEIKSYAKEIGKEIQELSEEDKYTKETSESFKSAIDIGESNMYILLGNVGEGKSIEMARLYNELKNQNESNDMYFPIFYNINSFGPIKDKNDFDSIIEKIQKSVSDSKKCFTNRNIILLIDGVDEFNSEFKGEFKQKIFEFSKEYNIKIVISARKTEYSTNGYSDNGEELYIPLQFEPLSNIEKHNFIKERLINLGLNENEVNEGIKRIREYIVSGVIDTELLDTPLILTFLCILSKKGDLNELSSRALLYEELAKMIFEEHQSEDIRNKSANPISIDKQEELLNILSYCAYLKHTNQSISNNELFEKISENYKHIRTESRRNNYINNIIDKIYLIYRVNDGEYNFILKSFQEYFLARYLANENNGNNELFITKEKLKYNLKEWRNFNGVISTYFEILIHKANGDDKQEYLSRINEFLGDKGVLKDDNYFNEGFIQGVYLITKIEGNNLNIDKKITDKYKAKINSFSHQDIEFIIETLAKEYGNKLGDGNILDLLIERYTEKGIENTHLKNLKKIGNNKANQIIIQNIDKSLVNNYTGEKDYFELIMHIINSSNITLSNSEIIIKIIELIKNSKGMTRLTNPNSRFAININKIKLYEEIVIELIKNQKFDDSITIIYMIESAGFNVVKLIEMHIKEVLKIRNNKQIDRINITAFIYLEYDINEELINDIFNGIYKLFEKNMFDITENGIGYENNMFDILEDLTGYDFNSIAIENFIKLIDSELFKLNIKKRPNKYNRKIINFLLLNDNDIFRNKALELLNINKDFGYHTMLKISNSINKMSEKSKKVYLEYIITSFRDSENIGLANIYELIGLADNKTKAIIKKYFESKYRSSDIFDDEGSIINRELDIFDDMYYYIGPVVKEDINETGLLQYIYACFDLNIEIDYKYNECIIRKLKAVNSDKELDIISSILKKANSSYKINNFLIDGLIDILIDNNRVIDYEVLIPYLNKSKKVEDYIYKILRSISNFETRTEEYMDDNMYIGYYLSIEGLHNEQIEIYDKLFNYLIKNKNNDVEMLLRGLIMGINKININVHKKYIDLLLTSKIDIFNKEGIYLLLAKKGLINYLIEDMKKIIESNNQIGFIKYETLLRENISNSYIKIAIIEIVGIIMNHINDIGVKYIEFFRIIPLIIETNEINKIKEVTMFFKDIINKYPNLIGEKITKKLFYEYGINI